MTFRNVFVVTLALVCASCASVSTPPSPPVPAGTTTVAFLHANVIPMDAERVLRDQTVVVADGTIVAVGPASSVGVPPGARAVDARGRYLMPALCDMHVHLLGEAWNIMLPPEAQSPSESIPFDRFFFPYLANGVTTVQAMSATPEEIVLRDRIERGELLGPRLILARMVDAPKKAWPQPLSTWVASASEASEAVRRAKAEGYDKMKVYSFLDRESYDAIVATAHELDMDVIGHIPNALSVEYVLDAGQKLIAHSEEVAKHAHGAYGTERIDYFAGAIAAKGVWMTPTLVTTRAILGVLDDPDALLSRPETAYNRHPMQQGVAAFIAENLYRPIPGPARAKIREDFERFQRPLTIRFHEKGGRVMTGTDSLFPGLVPGFALQRELAELVAVGLTPFEALRSSTTEPFAYLGESAIRGTVDVGKRTDLLLLDANPLEDVAAAAKIAGVLVRGRWIDAEEIDARMREIAENERE